MCLVVLGTGCKPGAPPEPVPAPDTEPPASNGAGETTGLVGTNVVVEAVEVTDPHPELPTLLFTAGIKGYTEPCGCTLDLLLGGIDRVAGTVRAMAALAPNHLVLDAGNTLFEHAEIEQANRAQEVRKTEVIVAALRAMGTVATVPGATDLALGVEFYRHVVAGAGIEVLAANLSLADGTPLGEPSLARTVGDEVVGVIGAVDPARFAESTEVVATPALPAIAAAAARLRDEGATTVVLLFQGDIAAVRGQLAAMSDVDFVVVGADPRETDEVSEVGSAATLEAYDQGRYVGRLKLHCGPGERADWTNALAGSAEEIARVERVIEGIEGQLAAMPPFPEGEVPPIVQRQRERLEALRRERASMDADNEDLDGGGCRFLYRPVPMVPGYPTLPEITDAMRAYNLSLREINLASAESPPPPVPGRATYVGDEACTSCHVAEAAQWATTAHARAWQTLVDRDKQYDRSCVSCHVTGYMRPGGSSLGHNETLRDIQCEQCHGPGSAHVADPAVDTLLGNDVATCGGCHNHEHSPAFDHPSYLARVLGPGHGMEQ